MTNERKYARIQRICECKIRNNDTDLRPQIKSLGFDRKVGNRYDRDTNFIRFTGKRNFTGARCECMRKRLTDAGFEVVDYGTAWNLKAGGKYVVNHHETTLFAFTLPQNWSDREPAIRIAAAHTDFHV